jgi:hypothetical protein
MTRSQADLGLYLGYKLARLLGDDWAHRNPCDLALNFLLELSLLFCSIACVLLL